MENLSARPVVWTRETGAAEKRDVWTALKRGFRGRCPRCGEGKLFRAFLKVDDHCSVCGLDFTPHRADDLPAYLVIVIVGHIVVPLVAVDRNQLFAAGGAAAGDLSAADPDLSLALLQPVKGAVVAMQWALRMHGFDELNPTE